MGPSGRHRNLHKVYYIFVPEININYINIWHFDRLFTTRIQSSTNVLLFKHFYFSKAICLTHIYIYENSQVQN